MSGLFEATSGKKLRAWRPGDVVFFEDVENQILPGDIENLFNNDTKTAKVKWNRNDEAYIGRADVARTILYPKGQKPDTMYTYVKMTDDAELTGAARNSAGFFSGFVDDVLSGKQAGRVNVVKGDNPNYEYFTLGHELGHQIAQTRYPEFAKKSGRFYRKDIPGWEDYNYYEEPFADYVGTILTTAEPNREFNKVHTDFGPRLTKDQVNELTNKGNEYAWRDSSYGNTIPELYTDKNYNRIKTGFENKLDSLVVDYFARDGRGSRFTGDDRTKKLWRWTSPDYTEEPAPYVPPTVPALAHVKLPAFREIKL